MVEVGLALVSALVAWCGAAALTARCYREPSLPLCVWLVAVTVVALGLTAAVPAGLVEFTEITFRIFQIGIGLLGPIALAWGAVEYASAGPRLRFGARLVVTTLTIVPGVILSLDPVRARFDASYPPAKSHYDIVPMAALGLVHACAVLAVVAYLIVATRRMREEPGTARQQLRVLALIGAALGLEILVVRFGLALFGQLMLIAVIVCVWFAVNRAAASPPVRSGRRRGRGADDDGFPDEDGADDHWEEEYDDYDDVDEEDSVRRRRRTAAAEEEPVARSRPSKLRGIITVYTLIDGCADDFDDLANGVVEEVRRNEPDTLLYACHTVPKAPLQRIIYAIYRDELAHEEHEQQPYVQDFAQRRAQYVAATNVIELALSEGKAEENLASMLATR